MGFFGTIGYYICIPFAWLLRLFYTLTGSYGVSLVLFTLVIKLILLPFQMKSKKSMIRMSRVSGRMQELQKRYANNQAKMQEEIQKLYAEEGVSPMNGCLWSFIPLPIMLSLYYIIRKPITYFMMLSNDTVNSAITALSNAGITVAGKTAGAVAQTFSDLGPYGEIELVNQINTHLPSFGDNVSQWINLDYHFLGIDLTAMPTSAFKAISTGITPALIGLILIPVISGGLSFLLSKVTMSQTNMEGSAAATNKMMIYMMPLMSVYIGFILPAALGVYWIAQSGFSIIQEVILGKFYTKKLEAEEAERYEARQADRQKRMEEGKIQQEKLRQQAAQKQSLKEKRQAAQVAKSSKKTSTNEAGRVGDRPYARGRSFREDRYDSEQ